ncbi:MAG: serine/threonine-protein kinase [Kofleriaceae bacterium]
MLSPGANIGNYRVLQKIGTGGMGAVYLAEHPLIGKKVALKVIHKELSTNREVVQRFFQEARAVNKIGNEHIVEIHDFGVTPEGDNFYIMEYLEGRTLASVLTHSSVIDVMRSLHIGAQIANALSAAHAQGIIHRDLKPDNIMLMQRMGDQDFVKVLDFGLAKMFQGGQSAVQTAAGVLLGTPQYMSPEACESKRDLIDHRTDIYALGILLFQMMTGVLPFNGDSMGEVLVKQVTALPPGPRGLNPNIPPSVEQILLRCLAKAPDARFPTMSALREALLDPERYLRASPPIAPARSVAPGEVTAQQVMAAAAQRQRELAQGATAAFQPNQGFAPTAAHQPGGYAATAALSPNVMGMAATAAFSPQQQGGYQQPSSYQQPGGHGATSAFAPQQPGGYGATAAFSPQQHGHAANAPQQKTMLAGEVPRPAPHGQPQQPYVQYQQPAGAMPLMPSARSMDASGQRTVMDDSHHVSNLPAAHQPLPLPAPQRTVVAGGQLPAMIAPPVPMTEPARTTGLPHPVQPAMNTMRIATPMGHTSHPPKSVWPMVLVIGLVLGLGGGGLAVWLSGGDDESSAGSAKEPGSATTGSATTGSAGSAQPAVAMAIDAGATVTPIADASAAPATADAAAGSADPATTIDGSVSTVPADAASREPTVKLVKLTLDSQPPGATVFGPDGTELGTTPLKTEWPAATDPVKFTFKLKGYRDKVKELTVSANLLTRVDLDRAVGGTRPPAGTGKGSAKTQRDNGVGNGLERPD